ncbi:hypothetical protein A3M92_11315 [Salmonella enterica]|nr:hypothetical protein [Salmonella enterica]EBF7666604.1 hypothetical protein [Salmonella enterica]
MFAGKKSAQIREILISESAWEEMTCLFAPSLNIPFLHEVNTTKKSVIAHNALRFACDNGYHGELFLCRRVGLISDGRARIFILSDFERNDKANDNNYQFNC